MLHDFGDGAFCQAAADQVIKMVDAGFPKSWRGRRVGPIPEVRETLGEELSELDYFPMRSHGKDSVLIIDRVGW